MKYLMILAFFVVGCAPQSPEKNEFVLRERSKRCLEAVSFTYPQIKFVQCESLEVLGNEAKNTATCYSRIGRTMTMKFLCKKLDDGSYWADGIDIKTISLPEIKE